jgi:hypothetical protein
MVSRNGGSGRSCGKAFERFQLSWACMKPAISGYLQLQAVISYLGFTQKQLHILYADASLSAALRKLGISIYS